MDFLLKSDKTADLEQMGPETRPRTVNETGVRETVLEDLALKNLYLGGPFTVVELSRQMRVSYDVADQLFSRLRARILCEVTGMRGTVPEIAITSGGRTRAMELLAHSQYSGAAPISLKAYVDEVRKQSTHGFDVHPEDVKRAFAHMVFAEEILTEFGTALNSGAPVFLYGPPGMGKTAAAEALAKVMGNEEVWIPYAIEVDGQIITVYDPAIHRAAKQEYPGEYDQRWVRCQRPMVMVGGELTMDMLDLQFNPLTRYYAGPPQLKANNGVLVIDDFGRQRIQPEDLLNRWVVPLDRRIEFLTLAGGRKIEIPFELMVVFATNRDPATVLDSAFLRRIQTKIELGEPTDEQFLAIFQRVAGDRELELEESLVRELIQIIRKDLREELRSCHPRDLVNQVCWAARYEGVPPKLDRPSMMRALQRYFVGARSMAKNGASTAPAAS